MGEETSIHGDLARLSERQREVFALVGSGLSNAQIAAQLFVGAEAVRTHVRNIKRKLDLRNRVQMAVCAVELGVATTACVPASGPAGLSARAQEVAAMVATGATNVEIAKELDLGVETVKSHVSRILRKLDACNRAEIAVRVAAEERRRRSGSGRCAEGRRCVQPS